MKLVPIITKSKLQAYKHILNEGGEGLMLKQAGGHYIQKGRPKVMQKVKRHEEVDAFVTGFDPGDEAAGWFGLVGALIFSCVTEKGVTHEVAKCSNFELEDRIRMTVCSLCGGELDVKHANVDGKRRIQDINCTSCKSHYPAPALRASEHNRVAAIQGQEWTSRVYRLKHAFIERWREGVDGKSASECTINLSVIQRRFLRASLEMG